jgi:hypothetical protein
MSAMAKFLSFMGCNSLERNLDKAGFKDYCAKIDLNEKITQASIELVTEFEAFLKKGKGQKDFISASPSDVQLFVEHLIEKKRNTIDNFAGLIRYARFVNKQKIDSFMFGYIEGSGALEKLFETLKETVGEDERDKMFEGINLPPLGADPKDKPKVTRRIMERLEAALDEKTLKEVMSSGLDVGPRESYLPLREKFLKAKNLDDFLKKRHQENVEVLERHSREKTMFFAQEIDDEVVEYVRSSPEIMGGVREGDVIYETKIPYLAKRFLHEKDERMKRYYACHCGCVREGIRSGVKVSSNFCYCSAGFHKRPWEVIFGEPLKADVVKTLLKGDLVCRFAIHIPRRFLESGGAIKK